MTAAAKARKKIVVLSGHEIAPRSAFVSQTARDAASVRAAVRAAVREASRAGSRACNSVWRTSLIKW